MNVTKDNKSKLQDQLQAHIEKYTHNEKNGLICMRECFDICIQCEIKEALIKLQSDIIGRK